jgi:hypothetical protein
MSTNDSVDRWVSWCMRAEAIRKAFVPSDPLPLGKNLFDHLWDYNGRIAQTLSGTTHDPFYTSDAEKIHTFLKLVDEMWLRQIENDKRLLAKWADLVNS